VVAVHSSPEGGLVFFIVADIDERAMSDDVRNNCRNSTYCYVWSSAADYCLFHLSDACLAY
jgi:hypothetical protein